MIRLAILLAALATPLLAKGETASPTAASPPPVAASFPTPMAATFARICAAIALISGAGVALAWWSKRQRISRSGGEHRIDILATRALGARHNVVLIGVGDRKLLVGTSPDSVRALADLSEAPAFSAQMDRELPERNTELLESIGRFEGLDA